MSPAAVLCVCLRLQIRSCGAQVAAAERAAVAATAANGRPRRSAASTASSHEAEALRARGELLQSDLAEAALLADADRQLAAADVEDADGSPPALDLPLGGPVAAGAGAASALPPALEHSGVSLYHSLFSKRVCVLKQLLQLTRADLAHAAQSRLNQGRHLHPPLHSATSSTAAARSAATGSSVSSASSSISAGYGHGISPLLRWGLLSLFPLIDSVSRADPGVRAQSIRILLSVLRSAPPLSLAQEDEDTVQHMLRLLAPGLRGPAQKRRRSRPARPPPRSLAASLACRCSAALCATFSRRCCRCYRRSRSQQRSCSWPSWTCSRIWTLWRRITATRGCCPC